MKNVVLSVIALLMFTANLFSQPVNAKQPVNVQQAAMAVPVPPKNLVDCQCGNNLLRDGGFESVVTGTGSTDIIPASPIWKPLSQTPQWSSPETPCNRGAIKMWGNTAVFESVVQNIPIAAGTYNVKVTARAVNLATSPAPVRLKVTAGGVANSPNYGAAWQTFTFTLVSTGSSTIVLQPDNGININDGTKVSWIEVDNICLEKKVEQPCNLTIKGPKEICCKQGVYTFSAASLPAGCSYVWAISPSVPFTGQGTPTIQLNAQQLPCDKKLTITVKVKCQPTHECPSGYYVGTFVVYVKPPVDASYNMSLITTGNTVSLAATSAVPNCQNYWILFEANCTTQALTAFVHSATTPNYTYSPLQAGKCYVLYHYVNCGGCWSWKRRFFTVSPNARMNMSAGQGEDDKPMPKEFSKYLPQGVEQN